MTEPDDKVTISLRIPGEWCGPQDLIDRLPEGVRLTGEELILPDGTQVEFGAMDADDQFADIFRTSCRQPATEEELATVDRYTVNVLLHGPGGSKDAAHAIMRAASAIIEAGGAGVFIDNGALSHGGQLWLQMTEDGSPEALSFAYVGIIAGKTNVWTMGMHVLGLCDVLMKRVDADDFDIIEVIRYMSQGDKPMGDGHILADLSGPRFQAFAEKSPEGHPGSPMHNPFGRLRLVSVKEIAETN